MNNKIVLCNPSYTDLKEFALKDSNIFDIQYVDTFKEALKSSGFLLIIRRKDLPLEDDLVVLREKNFDSSLVSFDILYRHKLNYKYIIIIDRVYHSNKNFIYNKFNHYLLSDDIIIKDLASINKLTSLYNKKSKKILSKRRECIDSMYHYIKNRKNITSSMLANVFDVSIRTIERNLITLNDIYNIIGYDELKRKWYIIKK